MNSETSKKRTYGVKLVRGPFVRLAAHKNACGTEEEMLEHAARCKRPLAADLFCGAGGLSLGLEAAGFDVVLGVDADDEALETHRAYHGGLSANWDLSDERVVEQIADLIRRAGVTLVAGGPPCQPFSRASQSMIRELVRTGRRPPHDERRDLWESFLQVAVLAKPPALLMENVPEMVLDRDMLILRTIVDTLEELGYSVEERTVDTFRYGVPQFRQRLILVALLNGTAFRWPAETSDRVTVDNAIGDLPDVEGGWRPDGGAGGWSHYEGPRTEFQRHAREGIREGDRHRIYDQITRPVRDDDAQAFDQMSSSTKYSDLDDSLKRYRDDVFDDKYKRLDANDLSRTITAHIAKDGYWYIHPEQNRTLTIREAARIQTFPDRVRFAGPPSAAFRQIGNAVPPLLAAQIGAGILVALSRSERATVSTKAVSRRLAGWLTANGALAVPWLQADSRWVVIQCELLWSRLSPELMPVAWSAVWELATPDATLRALPLLHRLAKAFGREHRCGQLAEAASFFAVAPSRLDSSVDAEQLTQAPYVTKAVANLAARVVPGNEDPVLATHGVLRVAARFLGENVDRVNRLSDGRLAIARLIGCEAASTEAHLALIELANSICAPRDPECGRCPLAHWCVEAQGRSVQQILGFTNRAPSPLPAIVPSTSR